MSSVYFYLVLWKILKFSNKLLFLIKKNNQKFVALKPQLLKLLELRHNMLSPQITNVCCVCVWPFSIISFNLLCLLHRYFPVLLNNSSLLL